jgi:hypothetical protein
LHDGHYLLHDGYYPLHGGNYLLKGLFHKLCERSVLLNLKTEKTQHMEETPAMANRLRITIGTPILQATNRFDHYSHSHIR